MPKRIDPIPRIDPRSQPRNLRVLYNGHLVGLLAEIDGLAAFEYSDAWLAEGFSISPRSLPLEKRVFVPGYQPFDGLWGVFDDSLPDGWGRLLVDRLLRREGISPAQVTVLTRLALVGASGMGALTYEPEIAHPAAGNAQDLDTLAAECARILRSDSDGDLDELFALGGSSGGARPKVLTQVDGEDWIIKFPASMDRHNVGQMEYEYALAAQATGIEMPEVRLLPSRLCSGYFGVRRFDRVSDVTGGRTRVHVASASALLETSHRIPSLDYQGLLRFTLTLTKSYKEVERLFRLACFNVLAHNRDDHARNFAFLYDEAAGTWRLAPAFDLTCCEGMGGEHATAVNGKGRDISTADLKLLATQAGISKPRCRTILDEVQTATQQLKKWM
jgi:serine/threonine-protein kinase HipA